MVSRIDDFHVRWDFIGLSTDEKPTPEINDQVVNGSTFYCCDNSKLYIFYEGNWFEKLLTYDGSYILPTASDTILGGIKVGDNLSIDADGVLSSEADLTNYYDKDEIDKIVANLSLIRIEIVEELPATGQSNVIYFVKQDEQSNIYDQYYYDNRWVLIGNTEIDLSNYYTKTEADEKFQEKLEVGEVYETVTNNTTVSDVDLNTKEVKRFSLSTLWNYLKGKMNGAISLGISNDFTGNRVCVTTPLGKISYSGITHEQLNSLQNIESNIQQQLNDKQDQLTETPELVEVTDTVPLSNVTVANKTVTPIKSVTFWNYLKNRKLTGAISTVLTSTLTSGKVVTTNATGRITNSPVNVTELGYLEGLTKSLALTEAVDANAFVYYSNRSAGLKITQDYETTVKRRTWKQGNICNLSFHCKGDVDGSYNANWTTLGQVPSGFRPKYKTPIVAMIYDGVNGNDSAGGYINTDGWVVLWTNNKFATNNYQVRINATYLLA